MLEMCGKQVDGILMAPDGPEAWPKADSNKQWLVFYRLDQMTFTGSGTIEGNGQKWWELPCKPHRVIVLCFHHLYQFNKPYFVSMGKTQLLNADINNSVVFRVPMDPQHQDHVIALL